MSRFVLRPARILQTRLSPLKDEPAEEYTLEELVRKFVRPGDMTEARKLGLLKRNTFVGLVSGRNNTKKEFVFILRMPSGKGDIEEILKLDPSFATRLICAYKVEEAQFDAKLEEEVA